MLYWTLRSMTSRAARVRLEISDAVSRPLVPPIDIGDPNDELDSYPRRIKSEDIATLTPVRRVVATDTIQDVGVIIADDAVG